MCLCPCRCVSIFFVEFQSHFGSDYSATAWVHSLVDCTTMLCGQYPTPISQKSMSTPHCSRTPFLYVAVCLRGERVRWATFDGHVLWQGHRVDFIGMVCLNDRLTISIDWLLNVKCVCVCVQLLSAAWWVTGGHVECPSSLGGCCPPVDSSSAPSATAWNSYTSAWES